MAKKKPYTVRGKKWEKARLEYINGNVTLKELSERYGVTYTTLTNAAHRGQWTKQKDELISKAIADTYNNQVMERGKKITKFNDDCLKFANNILKLCQRILNDEHAKQVPSSVRLARVARCIREAQYVGRLALNISTEHVVQYNAESTPVEITSAMAPKEAEALYIEMIDAA